MESHELKTLLAQQIEENHKLLQTNNSLLHSIIEQNRLIFTITQKNLQYYSRFWLWSESHEVKHLRKELNDLYKRVTK